MKLRILLIILVSLAVVSCTSVKLVRDPAPAAIDVLYPTLETVCNGQRRFGLNGCTMPIGSSTSNLKIQVETVGEKGTLQFFSDRCNVDQAYSFNNGEQAVGLFTLPISVFLGEILQKKHNCLLRVDMYPRYKDQDDSPILVRGGFGYVYLRTYQNAEPGRVIIKGLISEGVGGANLRSLTTVSSLVKPQSSNLSLNMPNSKRGILRIERCNGHTPIIMEYNSSYVEFEWRELLNVERYGVSDFCIVQIRAVPSDWAEDYVFTVIVNVFKQNAVKLPLPEVKRDGNKVKLSGSEFASFTRVNNEWKNKSSIEFDWLPNTTYRIRQYTVQGRSFLCNYENDDMECQN